MFDLPTAYAKAFYQYFICLFWQNAYFAAFCSITSLICFITVLLMVYDWLKNDFHQPDEVLQKVLFPDTQDTMLKSLDIRLDAHQTSIDPSSLGLPLNYPHHETTLKTLRDKLITLFKLCNEIDRRVMALEQAKLIALEPAKPKKKVVKKATKKRKK